MAELTEKCRALIDAPNYAYLATVDADGAPQVSPVWIDRDGDTILVNTATGRVKDRNMRHEPRVALSIADLDEPVRQERHPRPRRRHRRGRRGDGPHRQAGQEVHGRRRLRRAQRQGGSRDLPHRAPARHRPGLSSLLYLSRAEVAGLLPPVAEQLDLVEATYRAVAAGRVELPPKPGVHPRKDAFIHAMPAYLADDDVVALKWVAGYPENPARGLPYISGLVVLNDAETGLPVAIMDGAEITAARTAAASGVCVRRWAPPGLEHGGDRRRRRAGPLPRGAPARAEPRRADPRLRPAPRADRGARRRRGRLVAGRRRRRART